MDTERLMVLYKRLVSLNECREIEHVGAATAFDTSASRGEPPEPGLRGMHASWDQALR